MSQHQHISKEQVGAKGNEQMLKLFVKSAVISITHVKSSGSVCVCGDISAVGSNFELVILNFNTDSRVVRNNN